MKKIHIALSTNDIEKSVYDYTKRLGVEPSLVVEAEYALWRTDILNLSIRKDESTHPGELRHLGWEDSSAEECTIDTDVNGIVWETFSAKHQKDEINQFWKSANYEVE